MPWFSDYVSDYQTDYQMGIFDTYDYHLRAFPPSARRIKKPGSFDFQGFGLWLK